MRLSPGPRVHRPMDAADRCVLLSLPCSCCSQATEVGTEYLNSIPLDSSEAITYFEIPITSACNTVIIDAGTLIGESDIFLTGLGNTAIEDTSLTSHAVTPWGHDSIALCADQNSSTSDYFGLNYLGAWLNNKASDGIARITGYIHHYGHFRLSVTGAKIFLSFALTFVDGPRRGLGPKRPRSLSP